MMTTLPARRRRSPALTALTGLVLLGATACGSTVQTAGSVAAGPAGAPSGLAAPDGLTPPGALSPSGSVDGATGIGGQASGGQGTISAGQSGAGVGPAGDGGTGASGGSTDGGAGSAAARAGKVPGIENGFIKIGIVRVSNQGPAYAAIGASGLAGSGYNERMIAALVNEINKTGIQGLKIKLVRYDVDLNDPSKTPQVQQQEACAAYTEDDRVFAAMTGEGDVLDACLKKAGVLEVCGGCSISTYDDKQMNAIPLLFSPNAVAVNRQVDFYVKGLVEGGYFTGAGNQVPGPPKVGFLTYDDPVRQRQFPRLQAELKRRTGLTFAQYGFLPQPGGGDGDARFLSALQNYLLQFKADGVNRVMMLDNSGQAAGYGMQSADKNGYYPRWGFNSTSGPGILFNHSTFALLSLPGRIRSRLWDFTGGWF